MRMAPPRAGLVPTREAEKSARRRRRCERRGYDVASEVAAMKTPVGPRSMKKRSPGLTRTMVAPTIIGMTWLRCMLLLVAMGAWSACGDDDYNGDSGMTITLDIAVPMDLAGIDGGTTD
jgi:hypothetical protein